MRKWQRLDSRLTQARTAESFNWKHNKPSAREAMDLSKPRSDFIAISRYCKTSKQTCFCLNVCGDRVRHHHSSVWASRPSNAPDAHGARRIYACNNADHKIDNIDSNNNHWPYKTTALMTATKQSGTVTITQCNPVHSHNSYTRSTAEFWWPTLKAVLKSLIKEHPTSQLAPGRLPQMG